MTSFLLLLACIAYFAVAAIRVFVLVLKPYSCKGTVRGTDATE